MYIRGINKMSRYNVIPAVAGLFPSSAVASGNKREEMFGVIGNPARVGYPTLQAKVLKNRSDKSIPNDIQITKFDFSKLKNINEDGISIYSSVGSLPNDSRCVTIDVKYILLHDTSDNWNELTYEDQRGLMQHLITCELEYFKSRFRDDHHFYNFLVNSYEEIKYDENLYKLFFDHNVELTIYSCLMWNALTHYLINEEVAFTKEYVIQAIRDHMPKAPTQSEMKKIVIKIATDVENSKFRLTDAPLLTPIQNFLSSLSFIADIELNKSGIYINATSPEIGKRPTNFAIMFGKKHLAMFELVNKIHYSMYRINQQPYKFKSLKKDLGL